MTNSIRDLVRMLRRFTLSLRVMGFLFVFNVLTIVFEGLGISMLLPIFELLRAGGTVDSANLTGWHWEILRDAAAYLNIPLTLGLLLAVSFLFMLIRQVFAYLNVVAQSRVRRRAADRMRRRVFQGFLHAKTSVQEEIPLGEIANYVTTETNRALAPLFSGVQALGRLVQMFVYIGGLFLLSVPMTLFSIGLFAVIGYLLRGFLAEVKRTGDAISDVNVQITAFIVERLRHTRLIRLSAMENAEAAAFGELSRRHSDEMERQQIVGTRLALMPEPLTLAFGYLAIFIGGQVLGLGLDRLGLLVVVFLRLVPVVRGLIADHNNIVGKWPSVQRVDRIITLLDNEHEPKGGSTEFTHLDDGIVYDHVSFMYGTRRTHALLDVTVTLPAHRMSALVGPSGAGKSTFVDLLPRLQSPTTGDIRLDGVLLDEFSTETLRRGIAFVPQQPQIFNITVAEHIRYSKEDASDEEMREAARQAGALEFIEALPMGFDTPLGEGGLRLSVGQRQRLDIARALVRHAAILILDEPTSALDAEAEAGFRDALRKLRTETNLTIIVIAHRLSTISDADQIVVLRKGCVEAVGSHEDLIAAGGWYAKAYRSQYQGRDYDEVDVAVGN